MRRMLAVLAAAAMLAGALAVRSRLERDSVAQPRVRLTCAPELETVCEEVVERTTRVVVAIEAAGVTADRLASGSGEVDLDGWVVSAPWPEIVDARRRSLALPPVFAPAGPPLARSPLVLVTWKDRAAALAPRCAGQTVDWRCLGEAAGTQGGWAALGGQAAWGPVKPGHGQPSTDDVGLLVVGQATAGYFGRADVSSTDLDDDGFRRWFGALERSVPVAAGSPLALMLAAGPAAYDAVGTTEAEAGPLVARSSRRASLELLYPAPMATADLVLAVSDDGAGRRLRDLVGGRLPGALAHAGWRVPGQPRAAGAVRDVSLPAGSGLPSPGLLDALRTRWREETGRP